MRFCRNIENALNERAVRSMLGLIFPAFLGTFLVSFSKEHSHLECAQISLSWWLLCYFAISFVETDIAKSNTYSVGVFVTDVAEVAIMTTMFMVLQVVEPHASYTKDTFWALLCFLMLLPMIARTLPPYYSEWLYDALCVSAMMCCVIGRFGSSFSIPCLDMIYLWIWGSGQPDAYFGSPADRAAIILLWLVMVLYIAVLLLDAGLELTGGYSKKDGKIVWCWRDSDSFFHTKDCTGYADTRIVLGVILCYACWL